MSSFWFVKIASASQAGVKADSSHHEVVAVDIRNLNSPYQ